MLNPLHERVVEKRALSIAMKTRTVALPAVAAAVALAIGSTTASSTEASPDNASARTAGHAAVKLSIAAQPINDALNEFARQSGLQIFFLASEETKQLVSARVEGTLEPQEALAQLLANTGLGFREIDKQTIAVVSTTEVEKPVADNRGVWLRDEMRIARVALTEDASSSVTAQEGDGSQNSSDSQASSQDSMLEEVVVTAQKRVERLQDVPISISVLSGDTLDKSSVAGITEALNRVPGVVATVPGMGGGTQVTMRGVGASGPLFNGASPVGYYFDSVPFAQIRNAVVPDSNPYDLERIEVLRGPQGTLYGVNAENGLVRILTHDADLNEFEFKARTTLSSTDSGGENYRGDMAVNVPLINGKLAARAVLGYQNLDGWIDRPNKRDINDSQVRNYRLKVNGQPTEALSVGLFAWRSSDDRGAPSISDAAAASFSVIDEPITTDYETYGFKLGYELSHFSLTSMTSYVDYTNKGAIDLIAVAPSLSGIAFHSNFWSRTFAEEILLNSKHAGLWHWTAGAFYRDADDRFTQALAGLGARNVAESYALFGELSRRFFDNKLEWTLGLRYFQEEVATVDDAHPAQAEKASFDSTTPRLVLTWYPGSTLMVYGSYSEGFRSGLPVGHALKIAAPGFPETEPDKLRNYEIGAKGDILNQRVSFETAAYYIDWNKVQQSTAVALHDALLGSDITIIGLANGTSASGLGVDFGMTVRPINSVELGVNMSWNDLTFDSARFDSLGRLLFEESARLASSSEYTLGAFADYTFVLGASGLSATLSASGNYSSEQIGREFNPAAGTVLIRRSDSLLISRASFSVTSADDHWTAMLFGDNLNNEEGIAEPQFLGGGTIPSWAPRIRPRTIGVQFDYRW
jgi:iron complex outermembrane recepter protein